MCPSSSTYFSSVLLLHDGNSAVHDDLTGRCACHDASLRRHGELPLPAARQASPGLLGGFDAAGANDVVGIDSGESSMVRCQTMA